MIRLEHVSCGYGELRVLEDFSLHVEQGEILAVIGRSGCGKTTMLKLITDCFCQTPERSMWRD